MKVFMTLDEAWAEAMAAVPTGWRPISLRPHEDWQPVPNVEPRWEASTCSMALFDGETDSDDQIVFGAGSSPIAALHDLATRLYQPLRLVTNHPIDI